MTAPNSSPQTIPSSLATPALPRISVITISFNVREALRRTIASVNGQTYPNIEHVFIDGASTDGSLSLIQHAARPNALITSERDEGIADAFNKGTRQATGDYLCYLNAGDTFAEPDVLARVADAIATTAPVAAKPAVFYGDFISVDGEIPRQHHASAALGDFAWGNPINHQAAFVPRQVARDFPYDQRLTLGMDYDLWLRMHDRVVFRKLQFPIAVFEMGGRSSSAAWEVHSLNIHRMLWHVNRGTRMGAVDMLGIAGRALRLKLNWFIRGLIGHRLSLAIRAAKSRRLARREQQPASARLKEVT